MKDMVSRDSHPSGAAQASREPLPSLCHQFCCFWELNRASAPESRSQLKWKDPDVLDSGSQKRKGIPSHWRLHTTYFRGYVVLVPALSMGCAVQLWVDHLPSLGILKFTLRATVVWSNDKRFFFPSIYSFLRCIGHIALCTFKVYSIMTRFTSWNDDCDKFSEAPSSHTGTKIQK